MCEYARMTSEWVRTVVWTVLPCMYSSKVAGLTTFLPFLVLVLVFAGVVCDLPLPSTLTLVGERTLESFAFAAVLVRALLDGGFMTAVPLPFEDGVRGDGEGEAARGLTGLLALPLPLDEGGRMMGRSSSDSLTMSADALLTWDDTGGFERPDCAHT